MQPLPTPTLVAVTNARELSQQPIACRYQTAVYRNLEVNMPTTLKIFLNAHNLPILGLFQLDDFLKFSAQIHVCQSNSLPKWMWLSCQSGYFHYQRFAVRIQSTAKFYNLPIDCQLQKRRKNKKRGREWSIENSFITSLNMRGLNFVNKI